MSRTIENLQNWGVEDFEVTFQIESGEMQGPISMMELVSTFREITGPAEPLKPGVLASIFVGKVTVFRDDVEIGYIRSNGTFRYLAASTIRDALAWAIATDIGQEKLVRVGIDRLADHVQTVVSMNGTNEDAFFGPWFRAMKKVFAYGLTTRYGDGHCGHAISMWKIATRIIFGQEHEGYSFMY
jgi:hypothetical protein